MDNRYFKYAIGMAGYTASKYAGKGMRGKFCIAVHLDDNEEYPFGVIASIVANEDDPDERSNLASILDKTKSIQKGAYSWVLYWPEMEWTDDPYYKDEPDKVIFLEVPKDRNIGPTSHEIMLTDEPDVENVCDET